jgi:hypothetical protein
MSLAGRSATLPSTLAPEDWDDSVWIARQMVLDAGAQAARLRRQASQQAATICETAERETEIIWQRASGQAAAIREAAEREAAELRALVMTLSAGPAELVEVDGGVVGREAARLVGKPGTRTSGKSARSARPTRPTRPMRPVKSARPRATSAKKPPTRTRQYQAMRVATAATAAMFSIAVITGTAELGLHGFKFFVFRQGGTGETGSPETDQQFLAAEAAAAKAAAKPVAAKVAARPAAAKASGGKARGHKAHTPVRHSANSTPG